jgi:hypothetical protein
MVYFTRVLPHAIKIGFTMDQDLRTRMNQLSRRYGKPVELLAFCEGGREVERYFHRKFADYRLGRSEHFRLAPEILGEIGHPLLLEMSADEPIQPVWIESPSLVGC